MAERPGTTEATEGPEPVAPIDPAMQAEVGHLDYILADVRLLFQQGAISERGYRFLVDRYEGRRTRLLTPATPEPAPPSGQATPPPTSADTMPEPAPAVSPTLPPVAVPVGATVSAPAMARPPRRPIDAPVLLLWLGAFMVTVASLIFVGYSWAFLSGPAKTFIMAGLTAAFLAGGWACLRRPALRPAGHTFVVIGATLTPLTFVAAYNFWLHDAGLGQASLGLVAALTCAALYGWLAVTLKSRLYPLATLLAALAAITFGLAAADISWLWWPAAMALSGLVLWLIGERLMAGPLVVVRAPARWLSWVLAGVAAVAIVVASVAVVLDSRQSDWWAVAGGLLGLAAHLAIVATLKRWALPAGVALGLATLAVAPGVAAAGGDEMALALIWTALAAGAALATAVTPVHWRRALLVHGGALAFVAPWLALAADDGNGARPAAPFVLAAALATVVLAGLAWRWRQPGWLYGGALLATAGCVNALAWLPGLTASGRTLALLPLLLLAFGGLVLAGRRLGQSWAAPFYAWLLLAGVMMAEPLDNEPALLALVLVGLAALSWVGIGLVGAEALLIVPLAALYAAVAALLSRTGVVRMNLDDTWLPLGWLALNWLVWWATPRRGEPAWWMARVRLMQRWMGGLGVAGSLTLALALALATTDPGIVWWRWLAGLTLAHALLTVAAAEWTRNLWARWAGVAMIYLAALVGLRALEVQPLAATYALSGLAMAIYATGALARRRVAWGQALSPIYRLAGLAGLGLALLANLVTSLDQGAATVALGQLIFYLLVALGIGAVALWERQPRGLYGAVALVAIGLGFGITAPGTPLPLQVFAFTGAGAALTVAGLGLRQRSLAVAQPLVMGGLGLAALAAPVAILADTPAEYSLLAPALLLLAGLLGLVAVVERRVRLAEAASGVALLAVLAGVVDLGLRDILWYSTPITLWLFGLALVRARTGEAAAASWLTWAGVFSLLTPVLFLGLTDDQGWRYALLAGAEALALLAVGLRWGLRAPVAGGTLALTLMTVRQVFDAARALPNWAIIGVLGLGLLTVALVLLLRRSDVDRARTGLQARWQAWR